MSAQHRATGLLAREPVRVYLYGVVVAVGALAVALDLVDAADVPLWLGLAGALLAVPTVELTRRTVTSPATADVQRQALTLAARRPTVPELVDGLRKLSASPSVGPEGSALLSKAAADLEGGTSASVVLSRLMAEVTAR